MVLCCQVLNLMLLCSQSLDVTLDFMQARVHSELNSRNHHEDNSNNISKKCHLNNQTLGITTHPQAFNHVQNTFILIYLFNLHFWRMLCFECFYVFLEHVTRLYLVSEKYKCQCNSVLTQNRNIL